jgi:plastocyanin
VLKTRNMVLGGFALVLILVVAVGAAAALSTGSNVPRQIPPGPGEEQPPNGIAIRNMTLRPPRVTVPVGQVVIFTNADPFDHQIVATSGARFDSGRLHVSQNFRFTPRQPGTITYEDRLYPQLRGTIVVTPK